MKKTNAVSLAVLIASMIFTAVMSSACGAAEEARQDVELGTVIKNAFAANSVDPVSVYGEFAGEELPIIYKTSEQSVDEDNLSVDFGSIDENVMTPYEDYAMIFFHMDMENFIDCVILKTAKIDGSVDSDAVDKAVKMCEDRIAKQTNNYLDYNSAYTDKAKVTKVETMDNYVFYCVSDKGDAVVKSIKSELAAAK